jgi:hypothetical protein
MKSVFVLVLLASASASSTDVKVTPVQKVIQLMNGMLEKGKKDKHEEQVAFSAEKQFCDGEAGQKKKAIKGSNEEIEILKADINKYTADSELLAQEIAVLEEDIAVWTGDIKAATGVRAIDKAAYDKTHKDMSESIDALGRAVATLKDNSKSIAQVQLKKVRSLDNIDDSARRSIDAFLSESDDMENLAPEANAFESSTGPIIDMLSKLEDKFIEERTTLEQTEMENKQAFDMMMADLNAQIKQANRDKAAKSEAKSGHMQSKAAAEGDLEDTTSTRDADVDYLKDLLAECSQKAAAFEKKQQLRAEEIEAIEKAVEIISSGSVSGAADKHLPALMQQPSFAQLRSDTRSPVQQRVAVYLQERGKVLNSRVLELVAARVSADPFAKVKKMIKDLIV